MKRKKVEILDTYKFLFEPARYKVAYGGRGAGRSWAVARSLLTLGLRNRLLILCAREFQSSISDSVHRLLADQIKLLGLTNFYDVQKQSINGRNGTTFIFEGLKHNVTKIKSIEGVDLCWVEEAEKVSEESWDVLIPTIRKEGSEIWIIFNPDLVTDPTYRRFVLNPPPESIVKKTTYRDNPCFPSTLKKEKDYMYATDPERAQWIWEGNCRSHSDAQVFKGKWVVDVFEPQGNWEGPYFGADWGFAKDPTTLVKFWFAPDGQFWNLMIEHEEYGVGVDINDTPAMFDRIPDSRTHIIYADSSRPETINYMANQGFHILSAPKWSGSVEDGIAWIRGMNKIVIHDRCKHAQEEARNYSYKVDRLTGDVLPQILKGFDHIWDAVRYGASPLIRTEEEEEIVYYYDPVRISPI